MVLPCIQTFIRQNLRVSSVQKCGLFGQPSCSDADDQPPLIHPDIPVLPVRCILRRILCSHCRRIQTPDHGYPVWHRRTHRYPLRMSPVSEVAAQEVRQAVLANSIRKQTVQQILLLRYRKKQLFFQTMPSLTAKAPQGPPSPASSAVYLSQESAS